MEPPGFPKAFLDAAFLGNVEVIERLIAEVEKVDGKISYATLKTPEEGCNALHLAAAQGRTQMCRDLIRNLKFHDINASDDSGRTPLIQAVLWKHRRTVDFLIDNGADVTKGTLKGYTPSHCAAEKGSKELIQLLISKGADLNAFAEPGTPLHCAAAHGSFEAVKYLLDLRADPNSLSLVYMSPLLLSMLANSLECMELLLKAGADPDTPAGDTTPLCYAASEPNEKMIHILLKAGADPDRIDCLFSYAFFIENLTLVSVRVQQPLEHAALIGATEVVKVLFPVTSRITCYPDWSIGGVMQYVRSGKASAQRKIKQKLIFDWGKGKSCVALEPRWVKAHFREGAAWKVLKKYDKAAEAFSRALALDPGNKEIEKAYGMFAFCLVTRYILMTGMHLVNVTRPAVRMLNRLENNEFVAEYFVGKEDALV
ncbi:OLC1v1016098C1 [Oldenlandia corymbosa var. corymbosa]|uniref:OLC1v1016098C1 n=1 Tax=Oldenlandia corymbosa var. corymbosa TaxID=529605 RepID=A0AAV1E570_OLDCO|nr:OLC1v1016098C1 [Oldenlandia corymbosa var. corymbosa]